MKLNNKGITLVEVIVSFALLMIILVGLFNIIMEVKSDVTDKQMEKEFKDFDNLMIARKQGDLIKNKVTSCENLSQDKKSIDCYFNGTKRNIKIDNGKIIYNDATYEIPYFSNTEILSQSSLSKIDLENNILTITLEYSYVDGTKKFGFTIVHPLSEITQ